MPVSCKAAAISASFSAPLAGILLIALGIFLFSLPLRTGTWYGFVLGVFWIPILVGGALMARADELGLSLIHSGP